MRIPFGPSAADVCFCMIGIPVGLSRLTASVAARFHILKARPWMYHNIGADRVGYGGIH